MRILGIMSGSSLDGLDIVSVVFNEEPQLSWTVDYADAFPIPDDIEQRLSSIVDQTAIEIAKTEFIYSKFVASCINKVKNQLEGQPFCSSIHGHTVLHLPEIKTSWQLLNGGLVASLTGIDVICDFRNNDMALGGQGTPMAVIADRDLFPGYDFYINMGGIANISYKDDNKWHAFDIAPCNQVNNYFSQKLGYEFDKNSLLASKGTIHPTLLNALLNDDFIKQSHPKSIDNSWIKKYWIPLIESYNLKSEDALATLNQFIIEVIKVEVLSKKGSIFITGGGAKNTYFINGLIKSLGPEYDCIKSDEQTIDFKEAILMSYLAFLRIKGKSNFISSATGAKSDVIGGAWYKSI